MSASGEASTLPPNVFTDDRGPIVLGVVIFCLAWSTVMVTLRFWTRGFVVKSLGIDDYACVLSLFVIVGTGVSIAYMTTYGLGRHIYAIDQANIPLYLRAFYVSIVMYCSGLMFLKLTFLLQYYRLLAVEKFTNMRIVYLVSMFIVGGWALSQVMVGIFTCNPISGFWDLTIQAKCIPNIPQWYINAAGNIITDVAVFCLPLPVIWKLHLARPSKILLLGIFCLGFFTVIISIVRIRFLKMFEDFTWENADASIWSVVELTSAITCACLPTLRPLLVHIFPRLRSQLQWGSRSHSSNTAKPSRGYTQTIGTNPSALESQLDSPDARAKRKGSDSAASLHDSDVELARQPSSGRNGFNHNPFGVQVTHEVSMDFHHGSAGQANEFGVTGFVSPNRHARYAERTGWN